MKTYPKMNRAIVGILRHGNEPSQYAAQRIVELEAEVNNIRITAARVVKLYVPPYTDQHGVQARDLDRAILSLRNAAVRPREEP